MADIVRCGCGARVRLPRDSANRRFRCPKCKTGIALTVDAAVLAVTTLHPGAEGTTCSICQSLVGTDDPMVTCPQCHQAYHRECWAEVGGCGTYGCKQAPNPDKNGGSGGPPLSAWGDTKSCPACGEMIKAIALRCRYCSTDFDTVDPLTVDDLRAKTRKGESAKTLRTTVIVLFVLSLVGLLAPLVAIVAMAALLPRRQQLGKEGPLFQVLAYSAIGLSVVYSTLMLLFAVF